MNNSEIYGSRLSERDEDEPHDQLFAPAPNKSTLDSNMISIHMDDDKKSVMHTELHDDPEENIIP